MLLSTKWILRCMTAMMIIWRKQKKKDYSLIISQDIMVMVHVCPRHIGLGEFLGFWQVVHDRN